MDAKTTAEQVRLRDVLASEPAGTLFFVDDTFEHMNLSTRTAKVNVGQGQSSLQLYHKWLGANDEDYGSAWRQGMFQVWKGAEHPKPLIFFKAPPVDNIRALAARWPTGGPLYTPMLDEQRPYHQFRGTREVRGRFLEFLFSQHPAFCFYKKKSCFNYYTPKPPPWHWLGSKLDADEEFLRLVKTCKHRFMIGACAFI